MAIYAALLSALSAAQEAALDPVIEQLLSVQYVGDPVVSPDGSKAVYSLQQHDSEVDSYQDDLWLVQVGSGESHQLTHSAASEYSPRWLPDGSGLLFLSDRHDPEEGEPQLWLLRIGGGEARQLTELEGGIEDYDVSPDGTRLVVVAPEPDPFEAAEDETPPPLVIDRFAFKEDGTGYLVAGRGFHLVQLDSGDSEPLEVAGYDIALPSFSPEGDRLAYVARARPPADERASRDVYVAPLQRPGRGRAVAQTPRDECPGYLEQRPQWHPGGELIACIALNYDEEGYYAQSELVLLDVDAGSVRELTGALDLNVGAPVFDRDGAGLWFNIEDDMTLQLAHYDLGGGEIRRVLNGSRSISSYSSPAANGSQVLRISTEAQPAELYALRDGAVRRLTTHNDQLLQQRPWSSAERISFPSADGTDIHALLLRPQGVSKRKKLPLVLWLHGGPTSQFAHEARLDPQLFAAHGYAVLLPNPRGSTGRGLEFSKGIWAAWGSVDVADVLAGVDYLVEQGVVDPDRLAVGGWSYGGMLTNYVIASDKRFKAAASGAAISNVWAGFGTDQYIREYLSELGTPWDNPQAWDRVSYPFKHADRIETPTLFMVGENDYNVPLLATEQMYQALKVLRIPTQMVIYPGQSHGLGVPSYNADRWQRYLDWFEEFL